MMNDGGLMMGNGVYGVGNGGYGAGGGAGGEHGSDYSEVRTLHASQVHTGWKWGGFRVHGQQVWRRWR